ncbi:MAG: DUF3618 domain-containing protein [Gordonia sp. (in: high G+C Gram-positive bacteria)]|uniref:DUF3618 domain-containing protein n=1 Tax=Gordonia sp. (in: high G+C Gram-positive bacteria) TaxID=84139 RepID=UPI0039E65F25
MADDTERIEQQIAQAREDLANTLDQIADRANPQHLAADAKTKAVAFVNRPPVKYSLIGSAAVAVLLVVRKIFRRRR